MLKLIGFIVVAFFFIRGVWAVIKDIKKKDKQ